MNDLTDQQLLRDYFGSRSEPAFAELVRRHVDHIYSAALRMLHDAHRAEDVTQNVFLALAQNADQLTTHPVLSGWLHRTTINLAANALRSDTRRRAREQEAVAMHDLLSADPDTAWEQIAPHLDEALGELSEPDRDALLLRYFERKSAREMAQTLRTSEDAAQKRVNRAVERLRELFAKRGVTVGAGGLVVVIAANAVQAAPVGLAFTISTAAGLTGTNFATVTTAAATKTIAMTILQKTIIGGALALVAGAGVFSGWRLLSARDRPVPRPFVEITGELELARYVQSANGGQYVRRIDRTFPFKCIVGPNEWRIDDGFGMGGGSELYFDGTNVYRTFIVTQPVTDAPTPAPPSIGGPITPEFSKTNTVYITPSPGGFPVSSLGEQIPWLAYCSGTYLKREGRVVPLPTAISRLVVDGFVYTDKVESFSDDFGLPKRVWLFTSKEQYQHGIFDPRTAKNGNAQRARISPSPPPYPDGILKFRYEVVSSTNFDGWNYPTEFACTEYAADRDGNWHPYVGGTGKLLSIRESPSRPQNVWDPKKHQIVVDYRFRHPTKFVDGIIYEWTKAEVPPMDDPALQAEFAKVVARADDDPAAK